MLRRTKSEVLSDLPPKIIQDLMCDLSPLQQRLYNDFAAKQKAGEMVKDALLSAAQAEGKGAAKEAKAKEGGRATEGEGGAAKGEGGAATHIFQALQYLRKLSNHPKLVLSPLHPEMANVNKMLKNEGRTLDDISLAPKLLALRQILWDCGIGNEVVKKEEAEEVGDSAGRHRVLVFAQMKSMLDIIEHDLFKKEMPDVTYLRMDGSTPNARRFEMQQQFNGDPSLDVLLLTTHVGGLGLNLTGADTVVFVEHDWNPMRDLQAMDRAHRIGQKKVVNVYRLITKNTLEEKIMGLQRFKLRYHNLTSPYLPTYVTVRSTSRLKP
jgi:TATA-binding protein-associated factor